MNPSDILASYDAEVRASPPAEAGLQHQWVDGVLRATGTYNHIGWWSLTDDQVEAVVQREAAHFGELGQQFEWKVFSHDQPASLTSHLAAVGFVPDEAETFLVFDLDDDGLEGESLPGVVIRRATDAAGLRDYATANTAAFGCHPHQQVDTLLPRLNDGSLSIYVAYAEGRPISAGRLELLADRPFAGL